MDFVHAASAAGDAHAGIDLVADPAAEIAAAPEALLTAGFPMAVGLWLRGRVDDALALLDRARDAAAATRDRDTIVGLELRRLMLAQTLPAEALAHLVPYAEDAPAGSYADRLLDGAQAWFGGFSGWSAADVHEHFHRAFAGGRLVGELRGAPLVLVGLLIGVAASDDLDLGDRLAALALADAQGSGSAVGTAAALHVSGLLAMLRGDALGAEAEVEAAAGMYRRMEVPAATVPTFIGLHADVLRVRGEVAAAERTLAAAGFDEAVPDHWWFHYALRSRGELRLVRGRADDGVADLLELRRRCDRDGIVAAMRQPWASLAAPVLARRGDVAEARRLVDLELAEAHAWGRPARSAPRCAASASSPKATRASTRCARRSRRWPRARRRSTTLPRSSTWAPHCAAPTTASTPARRCARAWTTLSAAVAGCWPRARRRSCARPARGRGAGCCAAPRR